jgi:integrase
MTTHRQRRDFGALRKLPSKRWQASYVGPDLQRHAAPSTFTAKTDAEGWLSAERRLIETDTWTPPATRAKKAAAGTVTVYSAAWLESRDLKPRTRHDYRVLLDRFILPTFGGLRVRAVTPAAVRTWYAGLETGPTSRAHAYSLLHAIMATAVEDELIDRNPARIKGAGKAKTVREIRPATLDELRILTEAMPDRMRLLVQLSAWCALRFGEVTELRRRDVDTRSGVVRISRGVTRVDRQVLVDTPKSEAGKRPVHIPPHLLALVKRHLRDHTQLGPDGLLFWGVKTGQQLPHATLLHRFAAAKHLAGRDDLTPHALRHTGAVLAAQSGATQKELMARLGHTTGAMALRYQHASEERDLLLAKRLSKLAKRDTP